MINWHYLDDFLSRCIHLATFTRAIKVVSRLRILLNPITWWKLSLLKPDSWILLLLWLLLTLAKPRSSTVYSVWRVRSWHQKCFLKGLFEITTGLIMNSLDATLSRCLVAWNSQLYLLIVGLVRLTRLIQGPRWLNIRLVIRATLTSMYDLRILNSVTIIGCRWVTSPGGHSTTLSITCLSIVQVADSVETSVQLPWLSYRLSCRVTCI